MAEVTVDAELKRRSAALQLVEWILLVDQDNTATGLSDPVVDLGARKRLDDILEAIQAQTGLQPDDLSALAKDNSIQNTITALQNLLVALQVGTGPSGIQAIRNAEPQVLTKSGKITAAGDTTLVTPASGKKIRQKWITFLDARSDPAPVVSLRFGSDTAHMTAYGVAKQQDFLGGTDKALILNLDVAGQVAYTVFYEEVT